MEVKTKSGALLASFIRYCEKHPREGFWPALRSWCGAAHIFAGQTCEDAQDTAFWLDRRGKRWWDIHID